MLMHMIGKLSKDQVRWIGIQAFTRVGTCLQLYEISHHQDTAHALLDVFGTGHAYPYQLLLPYDKGH